MNAHIQNLSATVGIIRVFAEGKAFGDPYLWCATFLDKGDGSVSLHGVMKAPTKAQIRAIRKAFNAVGVTEVSFERMDGSVSVGHTLK